MLRSPAKRNLFAIAEVQPGFFTAKQAKIACLAEKTHPYQYTRETEFGNAVASSALLIFPRWNDLTSCSGICGPEVVMTFPKAFIDTRLH